MGCTRGLGNSSYTRGAISHHRHMAPASNSTSVFVGIAPTVLLGGRGGVDEVERAQMGPPRRTLGDDLFNKSKLKFDGFQWAPPTGQARVPGAGRGGPSHSPHVWPWYYTRPPLKCKRRHALHVANSVPVPLPSLHLFLFLFCQKQKKLVSWDLGCEESPPRYRGIYQHQATSVFTERWRHPALNQAAPLPPVVREPEWG